MEDTPDLESPTHTFLHRNRCCFHLPCFTSRHVTLGGPTTTTAPSFWDTNNWWARPIWAFKKVREWSEIVAGPKWKTFIRRFNRRRNNNHHHYHHHNNNRNQFQYDPLSYALNFDEGQNGNFNEDVVSVHFPDFSSRLAASPSGKTSIDLGNGAPAC